MRKGFSAIAVILAGSPKIGTTQSSGKGRRGQLSASRKGIMWTTIVHHVPSCISAAGGLLAFTGPLVGFHGKVAHARPAGRCVRLDDDRDTLHHAAHERHRNDPNFFTRT